MKTKTEILFAVIIFYSILSVFMGLIGATINNTITEETTVINERGLTNLPIINNVVTGYKELPTAVNVVLFGSLIFIIGWIIVSSLPTLNGGA